MWLSLQIICLAGIAFFDFKDRSIPVILFLAAFILAGIHLYQHWWFWPEVVINLVLALIQIALVATWLRIRNRQLSFFKDAFGWGDVLMMAVAVSYFVPIRFMIFIVLSATLSLVYAGLYKWIKKEQEVFIPLAGIMSILLIAHHLSIYFNLNTKILIL